MWRKEKTVELTVKTQTSRSSRVETWVVEVPDDAVFVEAVYDPAEYEWPDRTWSGEPEWVELYNPGRPH